MSEAITTPGSRSVAIGRDVIHSIIATGDHNQFFVGDYERLRDAYIAPWSVFERVKLDRFVGRDWLMRQVDAFLQNNDRGYFILEASAGLGKTAFIAHLVKERGYIHLFAEQVRGQDGIGPALKSLASQIVRVWELNPYIAEGVLPGAVTRPDFLERLLFEAAQQRDQIHPAQPIVLAVDGLDEAGALAGQNVLCLPRTLPKRTYILVTQRPVPISLTVDPPRNLLHLQAEDAQNLSDMQRYLEQATTWPGMVATLNASGYSTAQFAPVLLEKCRGVWIYLHYVVDEIERGVRSPLNLAALPDGLWSYYAQYWWHQRGADPRLWNLMLLPLLSTLGVVQESITARLLCDLAGAKIEEGSLQRLLEEQWRAFITVDGDDVRRYRLYHASLREFLEGHVSRAELRQAELGLVHEMSRATRSAHDRIAQYYLSIWGGLDQGLPMLAVQDSNSIDRNYGLRHLTMHLEGAGRSADIHQLLRLEIIHTDHVPDRRSGPLGWMDRLLHRQPMHIITNNSLAWYEMRDQSGDVDGFLNDVARAWRMAETTAVDGQSIEERNVAIGLQCRYTLLTTSINSLASNIPPPLLEALVEKQLWTPAKGLAYARRIQHQKQRINALVTIALRLPLPQKEAVLHEALDVAWAIQRGEDQAEALAMLVPHLSEAEQVNVLHAALSSEQVIKSWKEKPQVVAGLVSRLAMLGYPDESLAIRQTIEGAGMWGEGSIMAAIVPYLPESLLRQALEDIQTFFMDWPQAEAIIALAPHLPEQLLRRALDIARAIKWGTCRAQALAGVAPYLPLTERTMIIREAFDEAQKISNEEHRTLVFAMVAPLLPEGECVAVVRETLVTGLRLSAISEVARAVITLACQLAVLGYPAEVLAAVRGIGSEGYRAEALAALAPHLSEELLPEALAIERRTIPFANSRALALRGLAPYLPDPLLRRELAGILAIEDKAHRAIVWAGLAQYLPATLLRVVLADRTWAIEDKAIQARALATLVQYLPGTNRAAVLDKALDMALAIAKGKERAEVLVALVPHLPKTKCIATLRKALLEIPTITLETEQVQVLIMLAPHLPEPLLRKALDLSQALLWPSRRAEALAGLAPHLPEPLLLKALTIVWERTGGFDQEKALAGVLPCLAALGHSEEALEMAWPIKREEHRAETLVALVPYLPVPKLFEVLATARALVGERERAWVLAGLVPYLPETEQPIVLCEALAATRAIESDGDRAETLAVLAWHLPESERVSVLREALAATQALTSEWQRAQVLTRLMPHITEPLLHEMLIAAQTIVDGQYKVLAGLAPKLAKLPFTTLYPLWCNTLHILVSRRRKDLLLDILALAPVIAALGGAGALIETTQAIIDVGQWFP